MTSSISWKQSVPHSQPVWQAAQNAQYPQRGLVCLAWTPCQTLKQKTHKLSVFIVSWKWSTSFLHKFVYAVVLSMCWLQISAAGTESLRNTIGNTYAGLQLTLNIVNTHILKKLQSTDKRLSQWISMTLHTRLICHVSSCSESEPAHLLWHYSVSLPTESWKTSIFFLYTICWILVQLHKGAIGHNHIHYHLLYYTNGIHYVERFATKHRLVPFPSHHHLTLFPSSSLFWSSLGWK